MSMASPINSTFDDVHSTLKSLMTLGPSHSAVPAGAPQSISNQCAAPLKRRPKCSGKYFLGLLFLNVKLARFACSRFASCEIRVAGGIQLYSVTNKIIGKFSFSFECYFTIWCACTVS